MALDFRATQIEVHKLIASGALNNKTKLLFYPFSAASNLSGGINQTVFNTSSLGSDFWAFFSGAIRSKGINAVSGVVGFGGDVYVSGVLYAENGFSGSLQRLIDGSPYLLGGPNITIATQSNGAIAISASAYPDSFWYSINSNRIGTSGSINISGSTTSNTIFITSSTGIVLGVSGSSVFASSSLFNGGLSGSLQRLADGTPYLVAGPNVTITTQSNGAIAISASAGSSAVGSGSVLHFGICDFGTTRLTDYTAVGQIIFNSSLYSGSLKLRTSLATTNGATSSSVKLWNFTAGGYVDLNGVGVKTLSTVSTTPVVFESTELRNAANFTSNGQAIYELQLASQTTDTPVYVGGTEIQVTGSVGQAAGTTNTLFLSVSSYPDTPLPRLEWVGDSLVTVLPSLYSNAGLDYWRKPIRVTFQDGIQRVFSSSNALDVLYVSSGISGQRGLDTGGTISSDTGNHWYYLYLIPSGSNDSSERLEVIASLQCPSGTFGSSTYGPSGYTNFRYIGPLFWKTAGKGTPRFEVFKQNDSKTFIYGQNYDIYTTASLLDDLTTAWRDFNILNEGGDQYSLPGTISKVLCDLSLVLTGANETDAIRHQIKVEGALSTFANPFIQYKINGKYSTNIFPFDLPVGYVREYHTWVLQQRTLADSTPWPITAEMTAGLSWKGFEDQYLGDYIPATSLTASIGGNAGSVSNIILSTSSDMPSKRIYTYNVAENSAIDFESFVVARENATTFNRARYRRNFLAYRSGSGNVAIETNTVYATVPDKESDSTWDYNIITAGTQVYFDVTGSSTNIVRWNFKLEKNEIN